jgi:hypothetical protein
MAPQEIVKGEDQASARRRYRKNRLAVAAADKAHELASAPVVPPRGTHELASALANLCAGSSGDAVAARDWLARRGGVVAALKLIRELCANGGAPAPQPRAVSEDDESQRESTAEDAHTLDLGGDRRRRSAAAPETRGRVEAGFGFTSIAVHVPGGVRATTRWGRVSVPRLPRGRG